MMVTAAKTSVRKETYVRYQDYSNSLTLSNIDKLSRSWVPKNYTQVQKEKENFVIVLFKSGKLGILTTVYIVLQCMVAKKCTKSVMPLQRCCFAQLNLTLFWCSYCCCCPDILNSLKHMACFWALLYFNLKKIDLFFRHQVLSKSFCLLNRLMTLYLLWHVKIRASNGIVVTKTYSTNH